jgi:hypothetical protein
MMQGFIIFDRTHIIEVMQAPDRALFWQNPYLQKELRRAAKQGLSF